MLMQLKPDRQGSERDVHSLMSAEGVRVMGSRVQASPGQGWKVRPPPVPVSQDPRVFPPRSRALLKTDVIHLHPAQSHRWGKQTRGEAARP